MLNILALDPGKVSGLSLPERDALQDLLDIYLAHHAQNFEKNKYYEGKIPLSEVNLGIALPEDFNKLEGDCPWGAKCVDVLAARSMFDGFVGMNGTSVPELDQIVLDNNLLAEYKKACKDELKYGCCFSTLSKDPNIGAKIRFHSPRTAAARWDGDKGRIAYGMAIITTTPLNSAPDTQVPSVIYLHFDYSVIVLRRVDDESFVATRYLHRMGRPLMEPLIWSPTSEKPLGQSRIKAPIRGLIRKFIRTMANSSVGLEFITAPQKYLLGVSDEQYEKVINQKFRQYVGSILASTNNPETGEKPSFGQLPQGSISPHIEMLRALATQFSAATGLPVTDTGVVNDANPSSSDAIEAQTKTLVSLAEDLNAGNGTALRTIALMALAVANDSTLEDLTDEQKAIIAQFKNPAMPSVAATADAAIKISSVRKSFASTDTFLEMLGFSQADIRRIKAQEQRNQGLDLFNEIEVPEE